MRRALWIACAALAAVSLMVVAGWTALGYGGPPAQDTTWAPQVRSWTFAVDGTTLCDSAEPCDESDLARAAEGSACAWRGTAWLSGRGNPFLLRDVRIDPFVVVERGGGAVSTQETYPPAFVGWWWRAFGKQVPVELDVPCDAWSLKISFNFEGKAPSGAPYRSSEAAQTSLVGASA